MTDRIRLQLGERVKELTGLHRTARLLQQVQRPVDDVMSEVAAILPEAWQYPDVARIEITVGDKRWVTAGFAETPWMQHERFTTRAGDGALRVAYLEERPALDEGPFLREERELIASLAEMLRSHFEHLNADRALQDAHDDLERQVAERTADLRRLASELSLAEAAERRRIAENLHDHVGQALAMVKQRVYEYRGNAVFSGHDRSLDEIVTLLDQTITYIRDLTGEISPPILWELGLDDALDWLCDVCAEKHGLNVALTVLGESRQLDDARRVMLFHSTSELLRNVRRHAGVDAADLTLEFEAGRVSVTVTDHGFGFDPASAGYAVDGGFGLFSIRERMKQLGGELELMSSSAGTTAVLWTPLDQETTP